MASLFCCSSTEHYRYQRLEHETKFTAFQTWAAFPKASSVRTGDDDANPLIDLQPEYAVQLVQQVNYGPLESKRYFIATGGQDEPFVEVTEDDLVEANFQKLNS
jgi:hypothetical protein